MTNVGLLPGDSSLEEMIAATDDGILMDTNRSWSIDDKRLNFQFGCEIGWEIKNGKRGRMLRNPTYTGISPRFWGSMDMLGGPDEWTFWGTPNCGKGQPQQIGHTGIRRCRPASAGSASGSLDDRRDRHGCRRRRARPRDRPRPRRQRGRRGRRSTSGSGRRALTRFATSFIHQNVADEVSHVLLRVALDGRTASSSLDGPTDDETLGRLADNVIAAARVAPRDEGWPGLTPPAAASRSTTGTRRPPRRPRTTGRAESGRSSTRPAASRRPGLLDGGDRGGVRQQRRPRGERPATEATIDGIARTATADGLADGCRRAGGRRRGRGRPPGGGAGAHASDPIDLEPGRYEVVLGQGAVSNLFTFLLVHGFNAKAVEEGRSFVRLGEQQFDPSISLRDDVGDPGMIGLGFDVEGTPRRPLGLVEARRVQAILHTRRTARPPAATPEHRPRGRGRRAVRGAGRQRVVGRAIATRMR